MAWLSVWSLPLYLRDKLAAAAAGYAAEHSVKMDDNLFTLTDFMHRQHVDGEHKIELTKIQLVGCAAAGNLSPDRNQPAWRRSPWNQSPVQAVQHALFLVRVRVPCVVCHATPPSPRPVTCPPSRCS